MLMLAQHGTAFVHQRWREVPAVQAQAEALLTLATAQEFPLYMGYGACWRGWALAMQDQGEAGLAQLHQGLAAVVAEGQMLTRSLCLLLLAEAAGHAGQIVEGLRLLDDALTAFEASGRGDGSRRRIGSGASSCYGKPSRRRPKPKPASSRPWPLPAASKPNPGSCGPP